MGLVKKVCPRCTRRVDRLHRTPAMQEACEDCLDDVLGLAAGVLAGGGVGGAIATRGWYRHIKAWRRRQGP
ncbi:hypothetical protein [Euzebya rosea]|uniref:hypothetical protein n=1 Tax=Euzebya rosea TaxID=2052804 RepID=UPI0013005513|nr:hypothetical protein [Euzebya rosea]